MFASVSAASGATPEPSVTATPPPSHPPTCAERYPADGPAGVDLQLGCVVIELVGAYTGGAPGSGPARISAWLGPIALGVAGVALIASVLWLARRRAGRRFAPVSATSWWTCPACRSLNPTGAPACYACGQAPDPDAPELHYDAEPPAPQSFGRRLDR